MPVVGNPPTAPLSLGAALLDVDLQVLRASSEDKFDVIVDRPMSEEHPGSRTRPTQFASHAKLECTVCKQIMSILVLIEDAGVRLFSDAGRTTESSSDDKVIRVIQTIVNRAVAKDFQSAAF